ncbi:EcsC family protein [Nocardioides mangrovi]|uniref:EcsC family protein n=1 Tax=Nocardioides mangrovi TaxID=2874580 RepID=A0ABS7UF60_9ACTN|nr:EcsC family protein [Nocardioides mangrovi]MBZ5739326.1 EcsC family protein [Nocardioides mangrovi]
MSEETTDAGTASVALRRALDGLGPLSPAARAAEKHLRDHDGQVDKAIDALIDDHVRYAGAQGLLTSLGGVIAAPVTVPANITGLALIQARMVAGIAHLRGYDLADPRTHNAVLTCLLGERRVDALVREQRLPAPPMAIATAPVHDQELEQVLAGEVTGHLVARLGGKHAVLAFGRKIPVVGGVVGLGADSVATWQVARYAVRELRPRTRR